jgi:nucleotide-binding universal stress UspA family protein
VGSVPVAAAESMFVPAKNKPTTARDRVRMRMRSKEGVLSRGKCEPAKAHECGRGSAGNRGRLLATQRPLANAPGLFAVSRARCIFFRHARRLLRRKQNRGVTTKLPQLTSSITPMKTILAAIDSSPISERVVTEAVALARALQGRVVLLTVVQPPVITGEYAPMIDNLAEITAAGEKAADRRLSEIQKRLTADGVPNETAQLTGPPVAYILEQAKARRADYIVMGSHGHTAFYDLLVGSTTHGVLLRAPCPVVIIPPKDKAKGTRD